MWNPYWLAISQQRFDVLKSKLSSPSLVDPLFQVDFGFKFFPFFRIDVQRIATFIHNWLLYYIIPRTNLDKHHFLAFYFQSQFPCVPKMPQEKKTPTRWFKGAFLSPNWRSLNLLQGHLTIPKRSLWITRYIKIGFKMMAFKIPLLRKRLGAISWNPALLVPSLQDTTATARHGVGPAGRAVWRYDVGICFTVLWKVREITLKIIDDPLWWKFCVGFNHPSFETWKVRIIFKHGNCTIQLASWQGMLYSSCHWSYSKHVTEASQKAKKYEKSLSQCHWCSTSSYIMFKLNTVYRSNARSNDEAAGEEWKEKWPVGTFAGRVKIGFFHQPGPGIGFHHIYFKLHRFLETLVGTLLVGGFNPSGKY